MRHIQHAIDLVPGASLLNLPHYDMELVKNEELRQQVQDLLDKVMARGLVVISSGDIDDTSSARPTCVDGGDIFTSTSGCSHFFFPSICFISFSKTYMFNVFSRPIYSPSPPFPFFPSLGFIGPSFWAQLSPKIG